MEKEIRALAARILSLILTLLTVVVVLFAGSRAWFFKNTTVGAGLLLSVDDRRIRFASELTVDRSLADSYTQTSLYRCEGNDPVYYLVDDVTGDFATDASGGRIPFRLVDLLPGEVVDLTVSYTCSGSLEGETLLFYLDGISADTFNETIVEDDGTLTEGAGHSVLGVYKLSSVRDGGEWSEGEWMAEYVKGVDGTAPERIDVCRRTWTKVSDSPEDNYATFKMRIVFDLEQYNTLDAATNELSEKSFRISSLRVGVVDGE